MLDEREHFKNEAKYIECEIKRDQELVDKYETERDSAIASGETPPSVIDSYLHKNGISEEDYNKLKERILAAKNKHAQIVEEGLGEVKPYLRI